MKANFPIEQFRKLETPFYYYDTNLLRETLNKIKEEAGKYNKFCVHYAVKANANPKILGIIRESGLGADCVSGGEIKAAIKAGFPASKIVYAGVGKTDKEINLGLDYDIFVLTLSLFQNWKSSTNWLQQRTRLPRGFPYQSGCRCSYACQHHYRTGRK